MVSSRLFHGQISANGIYFRKISSHALNQLVDEYELMDSHHTFEQSTGMHDPTRVTQPELGADHSDSLTQRKEVYALIMLHQVWIKNQNSFRLPWKATQGNIVPIE